MVCNVPIFKFNLVFCSISYVKVGREVSDKFDTQHQVQCAIKSRLYRSGNL